MTVQALDPVVLRGVHALAPVVLNLSLGRAGMWSGEGVPGTIVGASVGDEYLDTLTGNIFRLDPDF